MQSLYSYSSFNYPPVDISASRISRDCFTSQANWNAGFLVIIARGRWDSDLIYVEIKKWYLDGFIILVYVIYTKHDKYLLAMSIVDVKVQIDVEGITLSLYHSAIFFLEICGYTSKQGIKQRPVKDIRIGSSCRQQLRIGIRVECIYTMDEVWKAERRQAIHGHRRQTVCDNYQNARLSAHKQT